MYIIILVINCHSLFCLWVVSPLQCRSSILVFVLFFIYVIHVTNHQNHCKCKTQMFVILCSHGLPDWFNKTYRCVLKHIDDIVIFACQLRPKYVSMLTFTFQRKIWRDKKYINMTMHGGQIRFYFRIYCRTLGILWYMYK